MSTWIPALHAGMTELKLAANLSETTFSDIFKGDILILLCLNIGATHVPEQIAFLASSALRKPSSGQRSNNGTKSIPGSVWLNLHLQAALSGVHEYGGLCHRSFVNGKSAPASSARRG
jgi:hypothetical protein